MSSDGGRAGLGGDDIYEPGQDEDYKGEGAQGRYNGDKNGMNEEEGKEAKTEFKSQFIEYHSRYYCGACSAGFSDLDTYRNHRNGEEHKFLHDWRVNQVIPGLLFCTACRFSQLSAKKWIRHVKSGLHQRCVDSLSAISVNGNFSKPRPCFKIGRLGKETTMYGLPEGFPDPQPMWVLPNSLFVGINKLKKANESTYYCESCDEEVPDFKRVTHLILLDHKEAHLRKFYPDLYEEYEKIEAHRLSRRKARLNFLAHKAEVKEIEDEDEESKELRQIFSKGEVDHNPKQVYNRWIPSDAPRHRDYQHPPPRDFLPRPRMRSTQLRDASYRGREHYRGYMAPPRDRYPPPPRRLPYREPMKFRDDPYYRDYLAGDDDYYHGHHFPGNTLPARRKDFSLPTNHDPYRRDRPFSSWEERESSCSDEHYKPTDRVVKMEPSHDRPVPFTPKLENLNLPSHKIDKKRGLDEMDDPDVIDDITISAIEDLKEYAMKRAKSSIMQKVELVKAALDEDKDLSEIPEFYELTRKMAKNVDPSQVRQAPYPGPSKPRRSFNGPPRY